jgi:hypothetical protein
MRDHGTVLRRCAVLLPALTLVLTGCVRLEAPTPEVAAAEPEQELEAVEASANDATARLEPACPAPNPAATLSAAQLNAAMSRIDLPEWQSADLGATAVLSDGRVLWVWGDTGREEGYVPQLVDNSVLVSSGTCFSQVRTEEGGEFFPRGPDGLTFWPMSVVRLEPTPEDGPGVRDKVVVYLSRIQRGERMWDFLFRGTTAATVLVGADGVPRLDRMVEMTPDSVDYDQVNWAAAAAADGEWMYLYGTRYTAQPFITGRELYVSRVPLDRATDAAAKEYWDGTRWQAEETRAVPVINAIDGTSQTLSVDRVGDRWIAISKRGGDLADAITMWTAPDPTGPWAATDVLPSPGREPTPDGEYANLQYTPLSHPDIRTASGALLVHVSRNTTDLELLFTRPQVGRVLFAEVPLV